MGNNSKIIPIFQELISKNEGIESISVKNIKESLQEFGFYLLMILFSFPLALPLPYPPGFTTLIGIPLLLFSVQMLIGKDAPWLPLWLENKTIKLSTLDNFLTKSSPYIIKVESLFKPRVESLINSEICEKIIVIFSCIFAGYIILPLFVVNHICGAGILIMFLSLINKDGIMLIIGVTIGIIGAVLATLFIIYGTYLIETIWHKLF